MVYKRVGSHLKVKVYILIFKIFFYILTHWVLKWHKLDQKCFQWSWPVTSLTGNLINLVVWWWMNDSRRWCNMRGNTKRNNMEKQTKAETVNRKSLLSQYPSPPWLKYSSKTPTLVWFHSCLLYLSFSASSFPSWRKCFCRGFYNIGFYSYCSSVIFI